MHEQHDHARNSERTCTSSSMHKQPNFKRVPASPSTSCLQQGTSDTRLQTGEYEAPLHEPSNKSRRVNPQELEHSSTTNPNAQDLSATAEFQRLCISRVKKGGGNAAPLPLPPPKRAKPSPSAASNEAAVARLLKRSGGP